METPSAAEISTLVPARLERLPWGRFHALVVAALGITWILDGLEVTLAGSIAGALKQSRALHFSDAEVGAAGSAYLVGAVVGALVFGWLTDRLGRKKLFFTTIVVYLVATAMTGLSWNGFAFFLFRFLTGCGIGGEYSGDQLDHSGADPGALSRPHGSDDQRQLLDRRGGGRAGRRRAARSRPGRPRAWLAARLPARRGPRRRRVLHADVDSREPALARHARPRGGGRRGGRRHRARFEATGARCRRRSRQALRLRPRDAHAVARGVRDAVLHAPPARARSG